MEKIFHSVQNPNNIINFYSIYNNRIIVRINKKNCKINEAIPVNYELILEEKNDDGIHEFLINGHTTYIGLNLKKLEQDEKYMEFLFKEIILKQDFIDYIKGKTENDAGFYVGTIKEENDKLEVVIEENAPQISIKKHVSSAQSESETGKKLKQIKKAVLTLEQELKTVKKELNELEEQEKTYLDMISKNKN